MGPPNTHLGFQAHLHTPSSLPRSPSAVLEHSSCIPGPLPAWSPSLSPASFLSLDQQPLFSKGFFTSKSKHLQVCTTKKEEGQRRRKGKEQESRRRRQMEDARERGGSHDKEKQ